MKNLYNFSDYQKDYKNYKDYVKEYSKNTEEHYKNIDADIKYLQSQVNYIITEQEKQRYEQMTMKEMTQEILEIQKDTRETLNKILERWEDK